MFVNPNHSDHLESICNILYNVIIRIFAANALVPQEHFKVKKSLQENIKKLEKIRIEVDQASSIIQKKLIDILLNLNCIMFLFCQKEISNSTLKHPSEAENEKIFTVLKLQELQTYIETKLGNPLFSFFKSIGSTAMPRWKVIMGVSILILLYRANCLIGLKRPNSNITLYQAFLELQNMPLLAYNYSLIGNKQLKTSYECYQKICAYFFQTFQTLLSDPSLKWDLTSFEKLDFRSELLEAIKNKNSIRVESLLELENGGSLNDQDENGKTLLHVAAQQAHITQVKYLCWLGADRNVRDKYDRLALQYSSVGSPMESFLCKPVLYFNLISLLPFDEPLIDEITMGACGGQVGVFLEIKFLNNPALSQHYEKALAWLTEARFPRQLDLLGNGQLLSFRTLKQAYLAAQEFLKKAPALKQRYYSNEGNINQSDLALIISAVEIANGILLYQGSLEKRLSVELFRKLSDNKMNYYSIRNPRKPLTKIYERVLCFDDKGWISFFIQLFEIFKNDKIAIALAANHHTILLFKDNEGKITLLNNTSKKYFTEIKALVNDIGRVFFTNLDYPWGLQVVIYRDYLSKELLKIDHGKLRNITPVLAKTPEFIKALKAQNDDILVYLGTRHPYLKTLRIQTLPLQLYLRAIGELVTEEPQLLNEYMDSYLACIPQDQLISFQNSSCTFISGWPKTFSGFQIIKDYLAKNK